MEVVELELSELNNDSEENISKTKLMKIFKKKRKVDQGFFVDDLASISKELARRDKVKMSKMWASNIFKKLKDLRSKMLLNVMPVDGDCVNSQKEAKELVPGSNQLDSSVVITPTVQFSNVVSLDCSFSSNGEDLVGKNELKKPGKKFAQQFDIKADVCSFRTDCAT